MDDFVATCRQELRNQAPVAAPPRRLRAHETGSRLGESRLIELGISPRAREAAHVDQGFGARLSQTGDELFGGTGAMTDGEDVHAKRIAAFLGVDAWRGRELERQAVYGAKDWFPF